MKRTLLAGCLIAIFLACNPPQQTTSNSADTTMNSTTTPGTSDSMSNGTNPTDTSSSMPRDSM